jgi:ribose 1,5-bisphosphokinase PhnN
MMLGIPSDVWSGFFTAVIGLLIAYLQNRTKVALERAANRGEAKVEEIKTTLVEATGNVGDKLDVIHSLVNSGMTNQMKLTAMALRRVAELSNNPRDLAIAETADKTLKEQEESQAKAKKE